MKATPRRIADHNKGFTLMEMVIVMVLLGVMAIGFSSVVNLGSQIFVNSSERDELIASARFVIERLNREIRDALPNSIRVYSDNTCIDFVPIVASSGYVDIPTAPKDPAATISVIKFLNDDGSEYACSSCEDFAIIYPLNTSDVYQGQSNTGKIFEVANIVKPALTDIWQMSFVNGNVLFAAQSPTKRLYIVNEQVSYCLVNNQIRRYSNDISSAIAVTTGGTMMAANLATPVLTPTQTTVVFNYLPATLQRNAIVQVNLDFAQNNEYITFNNEVHINNVP